MKYYNLSICATMCCLGMSFQHCIVEWSRSWFRLFWRQHWCWRLTSTLFQSFFCLSDNCIISYRYYAELTTLILLIVNNVFHVSSFFCIFVLPTTWTWQTADRQTDQEETCKNSWSPELLALEQFHLIMVILETGAKFSKLLRKIFGRLLFQKKYADFWKLLRKMSLEELEKIFQRRFWERVHNFWNLFGNFLGRI